MLRLYDTLTKVAKPVESLVLGTVTMYSCGPTVYGDVHIGNLRSFAAADLMRRYLEYRGVRVRQIMNITDVGHMLADADEGEDKVEHAARAAGSTPEEIAAYYTERFFRDIGRLGMRPAEAYPRATAFVPAMIALIGRLLEAGKAYRVGGNVYYDIAAFPAYGRLSGNTVDGLQPGARLEVRDEKKHPQDFALWIHNPLHRMQWEAPWGAGYPGWHIECSAMAMEHLGETIDLHTGGEDNKFPHHECEIAQSEGATGRPFARHWMHVTHLLVDGEKMSKSKGNVYTLDDLVAKGYDPRAVRYTLLSAHYRQQLNFTFAGLDAAGVALARFDECTDLLTEGTGEDVDSGTLPAGKQAVARARAAFEEAMDDDLNVSAALAVLFTFMREVNERNASGTLGAEERAEALAFLGAAGGVFGLTFGRSVPEEHVPDVARALIAQRDEARAAKDWASADRLRDELAAMGFVVEDTPSGRRIRRA